MYILLWNDGKEQREFPSLEILNGYRESCGIESGYKILESILRPVEPDAIHTVSLRRLMYISRATLHFSKEDLKTLATQSAEFNSTLGITGFLLYSEPYFFQVVEGNANVLNFLYSKIKKSKRHEGCLILQDQLANSRLYGDWHMKDSHIDDITHHPAFKLVFSKVGYSFSCMHSYLPSATVESMLNGENPLQRPPVALHCVVCFVSIVSAESMLENQQVMTHMPTIVGAFIDLCSRIIISRGGTIAKFMSDSCMMYFPVDLADNALLAAKEIIQETTQLSSKQSILSLLHCRIGIHCGKAVLCNSGSIKSDFTLLGDCVNSASRITKLADSLGVSILISENAKDLLLNMDLQSTLENLGRYSLKGKDRKIYVYAPPRHQLSTASVHALIDDFRIEERGQARTPEFIFATGTIDRPHSRRKSRYYPSLKSIPPVIPQPVYGDDSDEEMISLIYLSESTSIFNRNDLIDIARVSTKKNENLHITGWLLFAAGFFIQYLEGPRESVESLYQTITLDKRHKNVVIIHRAAIQERQFEDWSMNTRAAETLSSFPPMQSILVQLARSYLIMETYLPSAVLRCLQAGKNPLEQKPITTEVIMFASDIVSFTTMTENASLDDVRLLCNTFVDTCTSHIAKYNGEVVKMIGDCVIGYFPADNPDKAILSAEDIITSLSRTRNRFMKTTDIRANLFCGVGMDIGKVIMANCGSGKVTEFILFGKVANRVSLVESSSRSNGKSLIISEALYSVLGSDIQDDFSPAQYIPQNLDIKLYGRNGNEFLLPKPPDARKSFSMGSPTSDNIVKSRTLPSLKSKDSLRSKSSDDLSDSSPVSSVRLPSDSYKKECERRGVVPRAQIIMLLQSDISSLDLSGMMSNQEELECLLPSLCGIHTLNKINLSSNHIGDTLLPILVETLYQLPGIRHIDLSSNNLTTLRPLLKFIKHKPGVQTVLVQNNKLLPQIEIRRLQTAMNLNTLYFDTIPNNISPSPDELI